MPFLQVIYYSYTKESVIYLRLLPGHGACSQLPAVSGRPRSRDRQGEEQETRQGTDSPPLPET